MAFYVQKLVESARLPVQMSTGAAGYDVSSVEDVLIEPGACKNVGTGLRIAIDQNFYARTAGRSSLCKNHMVVVGADVIDSDYRGEVSCLLINHGKKPFFIAVGDRIGQIILAQIVTPEAVMVNELPATERDTKGLGSTGHSARDSVTHS